ncbi:MAG TPA: alanine racemase [Bryobacteraceae bacterium]|nr:alanine racemase [Bryobacteraceae bacterium]
MKTSDLDTPALLIDIDTMERNLERVAGYARQHSLRLRPHTKTHKIPALARRQIDLGATGITVAKTTEAEVMMAAAPADLLIAYPVVGRAKLERLRAIAAKTEVTVAVDSLEAARMISDAGIEAGILIEVDVGLGRMGVAVEDATLLVDEIIKLPHVEWKGLAFYPGHIKDPNDAAGIAALQTAVLDLVDRFVAERIPPQIVSGGSTPLLYQSHLFDGMNEIRPGTYIFNDRNTCASGACRREDCAATMLTTIVSVQGNRMMIDGGSKTFSSDKLSTGGSGFGEIVEAPGALFHKMNEEHGYVDISQAGRRFAVGDRVRVLMNHVCTAVNMQERIYGVRGEDVLEIWPVAGRGKLQ